MPNHGCTPVSSLLGADFCGGRSGEFGRSSDRSLARSQIRKALRWASKDLTRGPTKEIRAKSEPLIRPQGSPMTYGASPQRVQANNLVAGLTHTLGGVRSQQIPTSAPIPRSSFVPRTAEPPYTQVEDSTRGEADQLGLTAVTAMVDVEP